MTPRGKIACAWGCSSASLSRFPAWTNTTPLEMVSDPCDTLETSREQGPEMVTPCDSTDELSVMCRETISLDFAQEAFAQLDSGEHDGHVGSG